MLVVWSGCIVWVCGCVGVVCGVCGEDICMRGDTCMHT